jgi:hypothetical protein
MKEEERRREKRGSVLMNTLNATPILRNLKSIYPAHLSQTYIIGMFRPEFPSVGFAGLESLKTAKIQNF